MSSRIVKVREIEVTEQKGVYENGLDCDGPDCSASLVWISPPYVGSPDQTWLTVYTSGTEGGGRRGFHFHSSACFRQWVEESYASQFVGEVTPEVEEPDGA